MILERRLLSKGVEDGSYSASAIWRACVTLGRLFGRSRHYKGHPLAFGLRSRSLLACPLFPADSFFLLVTSCGLGAERHHSSVPIRGANTTLDLFEIQGQFLSYRLLREERRAIIFLLIFVH